MGGGGLVEAAGAMKCRRWQELYEVRHFPATYYLVREGQSDRRARGCRCRQTFDSRIAVADFPSCLTDGSGGGRRGRCGREEVRDLCAWASRGAQQCGDRACFLERSEVCTLSKRCREKTRFPGCGWLAEVAMGAVECASPAEGKVVGGCAIGRGR